MLPPVAHLDLARRPAFVALAGPAGAGKTTFAMKLALELERAYSLRVVVAGTDVERAGAPQQFTAVGAAASQPDQAMVRQIPKRGGAEYCSRLSR